MARLRSAAQPAMAASPAPVPQIESTPAPHSPVHDTLKSLRRNKQVRRLIVAGFRAMQRAGLSVVPRHFYWPIPDLNQLSEREWPITSEMRGIDLRVGQQLAFLNSLVPQYAGEYLQFADHPVSPAYAYHRNNGLFECFDAEIAYCMVRQLQPKRIIEIGSGFSTRVLAAAMRRNLASEGTPGQLVCVEPHPDGVLRKGVPGVAKLLPSPVQALSPDFVDELESGDILFIDSSHVVAVGSDVIYEILELLPRLRTGVVVHFHDIFLPADYPRHLVMEHLSFWSEQYMVQAFLAFNPHFEVLWSSSAMHFLYPETLDKTFPAWRYSYCRMSDDMRHFVPTSDQQRVWPSSFWIRKIA